MKESWELAEDFWNMSKFKKINQLKLRAGIQDNPDQEGLDLFAELIVKECAYIAWNNEPDGEISEMIKNEFGVEE